MFVSGISKLNLLETQNLLQIKIFNCSVFYLHDLKNMPALRNSCKDMYLFLKNCSSNIFTLTKPFGLRLLPIKFTLQQKAWMLLTMLLSKIGNNTTAGTNLDNFSFYRHSNSLINLIHIVRAKLLILKQFSLHETFYWARTRSVWYSPD